MDEFNLAACSHPSITMQEFAGDTAALVRDFVPGDDELELNGETRCWKSPLSRNTHHYNSEVNHTSKTTYFMCPKMLNYNIVDMTTTISYQIMIKDKIEFCVKRTFFLSLLLFY